MLPKLGLFEVERVGLPAGDPRDRDVAAIVVQGGERLRQHGERIGHRAAKFPRVDRVIKRPDFDVARNDPAQRDRETGLARAPVSRVREDHSVGAQLVAVFVQELREVGRPPFLLAFDENGHADRRPRIVRTQRARVHDDPALVVGRSAAVEPSVLFDRLERI